MSQVYFEPVAGSDSICYPPRVRRRDLGVAPSGNSRRALVPRTPAKQQSVGGLGSLHLAGGGVTVFVPGMLELYMCGRIYDPGMGSYRPRVRRNLDVAPRGDSHVTPFGTQV